MADEVEVIVTDDESAESDNSPVIVSTPVIVNESDNDSGNGADIIALAALVGEHDARIAALESAAAATDAAVEEAQLDASIALDVAIDAATEPEPEPDDDEDKAPVKPHWLHRPARDLFGGK